MPEALLNEPGPTDAELDATLGNVVTPPAHEQCAPNVEVCDLPDVEDGPPNPNLVQKGEPDESSRATLPHRVHLLLIDSSDSESSVSAAAMTATTQTHHKYYFFNGQRVFLYYENRLTIYLHPNHLGSTVMETAYDGAQRSNQQYYAFGVKRGGGGLLAENKYTGQKADGTGLYYYNARTQRVPDDPALGQFVSPDTLVLDASRVGDYN